MAVLEVGINLGNRNVIESIYYTSSDVLDPQLRAGFFSALESMTTDFVDNDYNEILLASFKLVCFSKMITDDKYNTHPLIAYAIIDKETDSNVIKQLLNEVLQVFLNKYSLNDIFSKNKEFFRKFEERINQIFGDLILKSEDRYKSMFQVAPGSKPKSFQEDIPDETKEEVIEKVSKKEEKKDYHERRRDETKKSKEKMRRLVSTEEEITEDEEFDEGEMLKDDISYLSESKSEQEVAPPPPPTRGTPSSAPRERASDGMGGGPGDLDMAPKAPAAPAPATTAIEPELAKPVIEPEEPKPTTYNINMGFQYYSVMMEQKSYLFYVYLSHEELKILDEEGKTVYKTTFTITTFKKEPPVLDLRIEGEGFEIHPLTGKIVVKKDAVNPPVMIFSVLPLKRMEKKKGRKKKSERRYLNVYIEFEEKRINHTVLSVIVQPKHFHLDLGPIQIDISKRTAFLISFISVLIATGSTIFSAITLETTSLVDIVGGFVPGLASFIFFAVFIITLIKNGIYPLKQKWSALLKFDKGIEMIK